jgi:hypothetical protein
MILLLLLLSLLDKDDVVITFAIAVDIPMCGNISEMGYVILVFCNMLFEEAASNTISVTKATTHILKSCVVRNKDNVSYSL